MKRIISAFLVGLLFSLGLSVSQMVNPTKVLSFLDLAGDWDPSLIFVMAGALGVTALGYPLILKQRHPFFAEKFQLPTKINLDLRLIGGSSIFGIGWGLSGYCPGPAIAATTIGGQDSLIFLTTMIVGMGLKRLFDARFTNEGSMTPL